MIVNIYYPYSCPIYSHLISSILIQYNQDSYINIIMTSASFYRGDNQGGSQRQSANQQNGVYFEVPEDRLAQELKRRKLE